MTTRGVPEVPMLPEMHPQVRRFLQDLRESVIELRSTQAPPNPPTNFRLTAQPFGNLLQWTRGTNADFYEVLWSTTSQLAQAQILQVGNSAQYVDHIGQVGIQRFYWVRAAKNTGGRSVEVGPLSGTSLASNAGVNPPDPPPPAQQQPIDQRTGHRTIRNHPTDGKL
jgi:hypothetical protein